MNDNDQAFPVFDSARSGADYVCSDFGMTMREYAAIKLKVPRSGDAELDAWIRESRRADLAALAMGGIAAWNQWITKPIASQFSEQAFNLADAMLAELDKEEGKTNEVR
jgi:hypothetical protein